MAANDYLEKLKAYREIFASYDLPARQIDELLEIDHQLETLVIPNDLKTLGFSESEVEKLAAEIIEKEGDDAPKRVNDLLELDKLLADFRSFLIEKFGMFQYVSKSLIEKLNQHIKNKNIIEVMAGNGWLTAGLFAYNPDRNYLATDNFDWGYQGINPKPIYPVAKKEAINTLEEALKQDEPTTVIMSWAPDTSTADLLVLQYLRHSGFFDKPENELIVIGEQNGATNSSQFWKQAILTKLDDVSDSISQFDLIKDRVFSAK